MNESFYKYMKIGVVHFMAYPQLLKGDGPAAELIRKTAEDDFFTAIEVTWVKDPEEREKVRQVLADSGLTVGFGGQPPLLTQKLDLNSFDEAERTKAIAQCRDSIDQAAFFGAKRAAFLSGPDPGPEKHEAAKELLADSIYQLCEYGQSKGVDITLETFDFDIDKKCLLGRSAESAEFARMIRKKYPTFGLMVDLSHIPMCYETPEECVSAVKDVLVHAHIGNTVIKDKNLPNYGDTHPRFGFPGGENDVPELAAFLRALLKAGYLNEKNPPIVSFEVKPFGNETSEMVLANAKRTLRQAWALV